MSNLTMTPPIGPDLPENRRLALRAHLLSEIHAVPDTRPQMSASPENLPRRRRMLLIGAPAAAVLVAVVAAAMIIGRADHGVPPNPTTQVLAGDHAAALTFLNGLATTTMNGPANAPAKGRYLYVKSRVAWLWLEADDSGGLENLHDREVWLPLFPGGKGRLKEERRPSDLGIFTAERLASNLPDNPELLRRTIYAESSGDDGSKDGAAFSKIGDLLRESQLPARTNAALYEVAAKIPGVELVRDATDAIGRRGVAVARADQGVRQEWIFDETTGDFLGERSYLVQDKPYGKAGMITGTTAVMKRAVVERLGDRP